jgi:hypothetical protein
MNNFLVLIVSNFININKFNFYSNSKVIYDELDYYKIQKIIL